MACPIMQHYWAWLWPMSILGSLARTLHNKRYVQAGGRAPRPPELWRVGSEPLNKICQIQSPNDGRASHHQSGQANHQALYSFAGVTAKQTTHPSRQRHQGLVIFISSKMAWFPWCSPAPGRSLVLGCVAGEIRRCSIICANFLATIEHSI